MDEICYRPIGIVHSPFKSPGEAPRQPRFSKGTEGWVEVFKEFVAGLTDLRGFSHIILLCHMHHSNGYSLSVQPPWSDSPRSLFATRSPRRPNPIGLSIVRLIRMEGHVLYIADIDMAEGTPVLDIKPYVPPIDDGESTLHGWLEGRIQEPRSQPYGSGQPETRVDR